MAALFVLCLQARKKKTQQTQTPFPPRSTWLLAARISSQITFTLNVELTSGLKLSNSDEYCLKVTAGERKRGMRNDLLIIRLFSITFYDQGRLPSLSHKT